MLVLLGLPCTAVFSWWRGCPRRSKVVASPSRLWPWQRWPECWDLTFTTWSRTIPLSNPNFKCGGWLPRQCKWKLKTSSVPGIYCYETNHPKTTQPFIWFICLWLCNLGKNWQFNSTPHGIGWGSSTKAKGFKVPGFAHVTDTPAGGTDGRREIGWVSLAPLPFSSFSNLVSASLHRGQIPRRQKRILQGLLRSNPASHAATFYWSKHIVGLDQTPGKGSRRSLLMGNLGKSNCKRASEMRRARWPSRNVLSHWKSTSLEDLHTWLQSLIPSVINQFLSDLVNLDWLPNTWSVFLSMSMPPVRTIIWDPPLDLNTWRERFSGNHSSIFRF